MSNSILPSFPVFFDNSDERLEGGYIYIGVPNQNPETTPQQAYWDKDLTQTADQPIRTVNGRPALNGSPKNVYVSGDYSITIRDSQSQLVYTVPEVPLVFGDVYTSNVQFDTVAQLLADTNTYSIGTYVQVKDGDFTYQVVSSGGHVQNSAPTPVNFDVIPTGEGFNVLAFGAIGDGLTDDTSAIQAAVDAGNKVYIPKGTYLISSAITLNNNNCVYGDGYASSQILANTDIEIFNSDRATSSTAIVLASIKKLHLKKTVSGATSTYDIHLQNPQLCTVEDCRIQSGHSDTQYSSTNTGGIFLDRPTIGGASVCYLNQIKNCWVQNNSIYFLNVTDSVISGGLVWGHTREFAIKIEGSVSGAIGIENIKGLITSKFKGGIWLATSGINQIRIHGIEFDGNPALDTGTGIYASASTFAVTVTNNTIWGCDFHGVHTVDPIGWTITGNAFWKCNAADNSYDDVRIEGDTFQPNGNVVSGNSFTIDESRTNPGYAIREVNGGASPVSNTYTGNGILGNTGYQNPSILILQSAQSISNTGVGAQDVASLPGNINGVMKFGTDTNPDYSEDGQLALTDYGLVLNKRELVSPAGNIELDIETEGFAGILTVSATRQNFPAQSRRTVYAVMCYDATATFTSLGTQDGSGGGSAFSVSSPSNGTVRVTDTSGSGSNIDVRISFNGCKSY